MGGMMADPNGMASASARIGADLIFIYFAIA